LPEPPNCGGLVAMHKKPGQGIIWEFRAFILRGNVVDLAIAVAIGAAFTAVVSSMVAAFITPLIGALFGKSFAHLGFTINGSRFQYGLFINAVISFVITGAVLFFLVVKPTQHLLRRLGMAPAEAPEKASCPRCLTEIPVMATRCQACTSELAPNWALSASE
jgi:large conductance mechanosensitive channel